jgi:hypothetical protein
MFTALRYFGTHHMFLTVAAACLICATCCSFGLEMRNHKHKWWPSGTWPDDYVLRSDVPPAAKRVYFFNSGLISTAFIALAFWASHYEKAIGRLPVLTIMCFFIAFINASIAVILTKQEPRPVNAR